MAAPGFVLVTLLVLFQDTKAGLGEELAPGETGPTELDILSSPGTLAGAIQEGLARNWDAISEGCQNNLTGYAEGLLGKNKKVWAYQMFDSSSRLPSGLGTGNFVDLGFFDECVDVNASSFSGKHCIGTFPLKNLIGDARDSNATMSQYIAGVVTPKRDVGLQFSLCLPSSCSAEDVNNLFLRKFAFYDSLCQTKEDLRPELDGGAVATLSFLGIILAVVVASTIYDVVLHYAKADPLHPLAIAFSLLTNVKKLLKTSKTKDQVACLHGIRVISTMWVVIGHRYVIQMQFPIRNYADAYKWIMEKSNHYMLSAPLSVDTFFFLSGAVLSYVYLIAISKGAKFNILVFYLHRYIRLTPVLAVIILIHATLLKYFGTGPLFPSAVKYLVPGCQNHWWKALLYFQNYGNREISDICIPQAWYLSVDMQLFIMSPILLIPLKRWPRATWVAAGVLTVCSMVSCFVTGWVFELNRHPLANIEEDARMHFVLWYNIQPYTRAAVWLIGFVLGCGLFEAKQGRFRKLEKWFMLPLLVVALSIMCTVVIAGYDMIFDYNRLSHSFHLALAKPAWAAGIGVVIFACATGFGGPINWFLSLPVFQVLSKLTYSLYLVHYQFIVISLALMRAPPSFGNAEMMYIFWGDFMFTLAMAVPFTLVFESPVIMIEQALKGIRGKKPEKPVEQP